MAATAVTILPGPACPHCKGGRVINGVPCADCDGSGRQGKARRRRLRCPRWLLRAADAAAEPAGAPTRAYQETKARIHQVLLGRLDLDVPIRETPFGLPMILIGHIRLLRFGVRPAKLDPVRSL